MPEVATAAIVGSAVFGAMGSSAQAGANRDAATITAMMAKKFGKEQMEDLEKLDYDPVNLMELMGDAQSLVDWGFDTSREKAYGAENLAGVDQLKSDTLARASFDFSSLPPDMLDALDKGILARTAGGPAGLAENISLQNRIALAEAGFNQFNALASNDAQFTPNPVGTLFDLGKFNTAQQQYDLEFDLGKIRQELAVEEFKFNALTGAVNQRAANDSNAVALTGISSVLSSVGQGISSSALGSSLRGASSSMQNTTNSLLSSITGRS